MTTTRAVDQLLAALDRRLAADDGSEPDGLAGHLGRVVRPAARGPPGQLHVPVV